MTYQKLPRQSVVESAVLSARNTHSNVNGGRATVVNEKSGGAVGKKLKKNIIKQRAGKNTAVGGNTMFSKKQSGFTSTANLKTRNHFESMSPKREVVDTQGM